MSEPSLRVREGTARRQRGKARVNKILLAARQLFQAEGYGGLRLRRVAELADISLGNLSYYFSSKADLFESMIDAVLYEYAQSEAEIARQFADRPRERAEAFFRSMFEDSRSPQTQQFFYQFWAASSHDEFVAQARERVYRSFREQTVAICRQANPALSGAALRNRAVLLMALVEGLHVIHGNKRRPEPVPPSLKAEFMKQVFGIIES